MKCERCGIDNAGVREYAQAGEGYGTRWEPVFDGAHYVGDLRRWAHDDGDDCAECIAALQAAVAEAESRARAEERAAILSLLPGGDICAPQGIADLIRERGEVKP